MSSNSLRKTGAVLGSVVLATSAAAGLAQPAFAAIDASPQAEGITETAEGIESDATSIVAVEGAFSYNQDAVTPNESVSNVFMKAATSLCASLPEYAINEVDRVVRVTSSQATIALSLDSEDGQQQRIMGCACSTNGPGGGAVMNADIEGRSLASIFEAAQS